MNSPEWASYARFHGYANKGKYDERPAGNYGDYLLDESPSIDGPALSIHLEGGNFLYIQKSPIILSVSELASEERFSYIPPEGTYVPSGAYLVGENGDIPVGKYVAYAGTISGGNAKLYFEESTYANDGSWHLGFDQLYEVGLTSEDDSATLNLSEGNLLYVEKDIVMKKQGKLSFD